MLGLLALAVLGFFWRAALLQGTFFVQDMMIQNYPFRDFFARALRHWALPLWAPEINCGFPLFAEGQAGILYPFNLLAALFLPTWAALNYNIVFHFWLAGAGAYGLLRAFGCLPVAALVGGLSYCCSGYLVVRAMSPNYVDVCAWLPVCLLLIELALQRGQWRLTLAAALVVGLQWLAGHPQAACYSAGASSLFALYRGWRQGWGLAVLLALGVPLLGLGLAAAQLLPTAELVRVSSRGRGLSLEQFVSMSLPPERLITLFLPNFFGNDASGSYWGQREGFFIQLCPYLGVLTLFLGLVALRRRRDQYTCFFCALSALALVLSLGHYTELFSLLYQIPGLKFFRIPTRFLLWLALAVAVLAGLGLDQILRSPQRRGAGSWWCAGLLGALVLGMAWGNHQVLWGEVAELGRGTKLAALLHYQRELRWDLVRCLLLLGLGAAVATSQGRAGWRLRALPWAVPLAVYADLYSFGADFNGLVEPEVYLRQPESAALIREDARIQGGMAPRVLSLVSEENSPYDWHGGWAVDQGSYRHYPQTLRMYTASQYGLAGALPGWSPLHLARHWEFIRAYPGAMDLAGVEYVLSYRPLGGRSLEALADGEIKVYRNRTALPRAYLVPGFRLVPGARERLEKLTDPSFDPRREVLLEADPGAGGRAAGVAGSVRVRSYAPEEVQLELEGSVSGLLVLSDTYYPGWRAFVDGVEGTILQANHVFRALPVPAGARQVVFKYEPDSFRYGLWLSALSLLLLGGLGWRLWKATLPVRTLALPEDGKLRLWTLQGLLIALVNALVHQWPVWVQSLERSRVLGN
jgi:hypothetical protein